MSPSRDFFFCQAEDGIRDYKVTGVQTCALPISVVLPAIERSGLTPETIEGLVTFALVAGVGALGGTLTTRARRQRARYETILAVQRALAGVTLLEAALRSVRALLIDRLGAGGVRRAVAH